MTRNAISALLLASAACTGGEALPAAEQGGGAPPATSANLWGGAVVDSALPISEALRRFQASVPEPAPASLRGGAASLDELLERLVAAYAGGDAAALDSLGLTRAEFGYLYYPESPYPEPPYGLAPDLLWHLIEQGGARGAARARERLGGRGAHLVGHRCSAPARMAGPGRVWGPCFASIRYADGAEEELQLVNAALERDGRFKLVTFDNKL